MLQQGFVAMAAKAATTGVNHHVVFPNTPPGLWLHKVVKHDTTSLLLGELVQAPKSNEGRVMKETSPANMEAGDAHWLSEGTP
eukprot:4640882-Prorocentrum_lima.AAC.1